MKKIKAVLVDDEKHAIETMLWELDKNCPEVEVIEKFQHPLEALKSISSLDFDILFLDIEMPRMNGLELLRQIENPKFDVIFTTAYDKFAVEAIKNSALDYLLKPLDPAELIKAINKFHAKADKNADSIKLNSLFEKMGYGFEKVALPSSTGLIFTKANQIIRCESDSNYTTVFFVDGKKHLISKTLKEIEELLQGHGFLRVHQSHLVNLNLISQFVKADGGYIVMDDGSSVTVSRSKKDELYKYFS